MNIMSGPVALAEALVAARRAGRSLADFPGTVPGDLATAYAVQDAAIARWTAETGAGVVGWKVAAVPPQFRDRFDAPRLSGPVMAGTAVMAEDERAVEMAAIAGGFAAVEAEFVIRIGRDLPPRPQPYTEADVAAAIGAVHAGAEFAGFPLATINNLGPGAVIACFGNNAGVIVGPAIADWASRPLASMTTAVAVNDVEVGRGSAASLAGGPVGALLFLANHLSERGRGLSAGEWVSTGATTGVHDVVAGSRARITFDGVGAINIHVAAA